MLRFVFILLFPIWATSSIAQIRCTSPTQQKVEFSIQNVSLREEIIDIPVVFHNVYDSSGEELGQRIVNDQLSLLNQAFNQEGRGITGMVGFNFRLAEIDPDGNSTSGIVNVQTNVENIGDKEELSGISTIKMSETGGSDPWNTDLYINIWLGKRTISLGSTVTNNSISNDIQGIIIDTDEISSMSKTLIHEMGHFFGLLHLWGNETGCDDEEDGISDTPFQEAPNFDCEIVINCLDIVEPGNYMDFSEDNCLDYFTKLQADYMQQFAFEYKSPLLNNVDCFIPNLPQETPYYISITRNSILVYLAPEREISSINLYDFSGRLYRKKQEKGESFIKIPTYGIPVGIYVLTFMMDGNAVSEKIFIN